MKASHPTFRTFTHFQRIEPKGQNLILGESAFQTHRIPGLSYLPNARLKFFESKALGSRLRDCRRSSARGRKIHSGVIDEIWVFNFQQHRQMVRAERIPSQTLSYQIVCALTQLRSIR